MAEGGGGGRFAPGSVTDNYRGNCFLLEGKHVSRFRKPVFSQLIASRAILTRQLITLLMSSDECTIRTCRTPYYQLELAGRRRSRPARASY